MTVELVDEAGTAIQATVWKDAIDKYDAVLEVGKVYYVGCWAPATREQAVLLLQQRLRDEPGRPVRDRACGTRVRGRRKMARAYELVKIDALARKIGTRGSVDVLAVVQSVGELGAVRRQSDNEEIQRRDVVPRGRHQQDGHADALERARGGARRAARDDGEVPIVAVRGLRVTDYNGVSLSTVARSELFVEPDAADIAAPSSAAMSLRVRPTSGCGPRRAPVYAGARGRRRLGVGAAQRTDLMRMQPELRRLRTAPAAPWDKHDPRCTDQARPAHVLRPGGPPRGGQQQEGCRGERQVVLRGDAEDLRHLPPPVHRVRMKIQDHLEDGTVDVNEFHEQATDARPGRRDAARDALRQRQRRARPSARAQFADWHLKLKAKTEEYQGERLRPTHRRASPRRAARAAGDPAPARAHPEPFEGQFKSAYERDASTARVRPRVYTRWPERRMNADSFSEGVGRRPTDHDDDARGSRRFLFFAPRANARLIYRGCVVT